MSAAESSQHDSERQNLLSRLLDATKECQLRFGGKGELATENDSRVAVLCAALENCLKHGLKPINRALAALKQVSDFTGLSKLKAGIFGDTSEIESEPVIWHVIREILSKHDAERYLLLKHITNDTGRGRAWLRSCLNEKSLERQINSLKSNTKIVSQFYEEWALVRDEQRFTLLINTASGLASVLFAITIDCESINKVSPPPINGSAIKVTSVSSSGLSKLLPNSLLSTFQRPGDHRPVTMAGSSNAITIPPGANNTHNKKTAKLVSFDADDDSDEDKSEETANGGRQMPLRRNDSAVSLSSDNVSLVSDGGSNLIPLAPSGLAVTLDDDSKSIDSDIPNISCSWNEDSANALSLVAKARSASFMRTQGDGSSLPEEQPRTGETMSNGELRQATVTMMLKKDEVEEQYKVVKSMLEQEEEYSRGLRAELEEHKRNYEEQMARDHNKLQSLSKDNELLKHQLKNYISAVQKLRSDGPNAENLGIHLDAPQPTITPSKLDDVSSQEASEYKRKLIDVAEMHGELMEFNEHLQKQLLQKEASIRKLTGELTELRGPLPSDINNFLQDSYGVTNSSEWRPLINVWIPTVFLKGSSSTAHHVYQVFLRIKDDEWNVYRRYSELHTFYRKIKKSYPLISTFEFPRKKSVGNKDANFVDERRKKLQSFLRKAFQHIVSVEETLATDISRARLTVLFPILDEPKSEAKKTKSKGGSSRSPASVANGSHAQQYTGL
ncbi:sorting nexin-29-like [Watersipora subatra]|uniref:sorting nexin-29-like n=1 Tax=Watersipora subatra TaxID=2589382 RepID=UPI00355AE128